MARAWERMLGYFEATVSTPGELGTLSNLEQHVKLRAHFLDIHDDALVKALGHDLPAGIKPSDNYQGLPRIVVPTVRTAVARNEAAVLQVILASSSAHRDGFMMWRPIGAEKYVRAPLRHVGRSVYQVSLPAIPPSSIGIEYYIECVFDVNGKAVTLRSPATGPNFGQTVIAN